MEDMLEDDFREPYTTWKKDPTPANNSMMLKTLHPVIEGAVRTHVGESNPLILSRARRMTLEGVRGYDPARGRLQTHLYNHLQGLKRVARQQTSIMKVPERIAQDRYFLDQATSELAHTLGREPSDSELANQTGFSTRRMARVRSYNPAIAEGTMETANPEQTEVMGGVIMPGQRSGMSPVHEMVYADLFLQDQKIMEYAMGLHGRRPMANHEIAAKLGKSPGLISQRKLVIQKKIDEMMGLSPFGG